MSQPPAYRTIPFNALDPQSRRRFIEALSGGSHAPVLSTPSSTGGAVFGWSVLALIAGCGVLGLAMIDFGAMGIYRQSLLYIAGYASCFFLGAWSLLRAARTVLLSRALPFKRGRYVFGTDMVIATGPELKIVPMGQLLKLDGVHRHVNGVYQGTDLNFNFQGYGREVFTVRGKDVAERIMDNLYFSRERIREAAQLQDIEVLSALDLFFSARGTDAWNDPGVAARIAKDPGSTDVARPISSIFARAALVALVPIALAPPFWFARNLASDLVSFSNAERTGTTYALRFYLEGDGWRSDEVVDELLPEAAFSEAQRAGTVSALRDFVREHPESRRVPEARVVIHERFVQVRQDFMNQAATGDPRMPVFMGHLLDWLERMDSPPVQVRFLAPSGEALALTDQNLDVFAQVQNVTGGVAPVSPHFTPERSASRENHITQVLQRGFAPIFPSDVMQLSHTGRITAPVQQLAITQPVFDVSYSIRPSGSVYTSDTSTRGFVGIHIDFHIQMRIPGSTETWEFNTSVEPPEHFTVSAGYGDPGGGSAYQDGIVYSVMADRAFDQLGNQLSLTFFRPDSNAFAQAQAATQRDMHGGR